MPLTGISIDGYSLCSISGNSPGLSGFSQLYVVPSSTRLAINVYVTGPTNQGTVSGSILFGEDPLADPYVFSGLTSNGLITTYQYTYPATYRITTGTFTYSGGASKTGTTNADVTFTELHPEVFGNTSGTKYFDGTGQWSYTDPYAGYGVARTYVYHTHGSRGQYRNLKDQILGDVMVSSQWPGGTGVYNYVMNFMLPAFRNSGADDLIVHSPFGASSGIAYEFHARTTTLNCGLTGPGGQLLSVLCGATGTTYGSSEFIRAWTDFYTATGVCPWFYMGTFESNHTARWSNLFYNSGLDAVKADILFNVAPILALPQSKIVIDASIGPGRLPPFSSALAGSWADGNNGEGLSWFARKYLLENGMDVVGTEPRVAYNNPYWAEDRTTLATIIDSTFVNALENDPGGWQVAPLTGSNAILAETCVLYSGGSRTNNEVDPFRSVTEHSYAINLLGASAHAFIDHYTASVFDGVYDLAKGVKISAAIAFFSLTAPATATHFSLRTAAAVANGWTSVVTAPATNTYDSNPHQPAQVISVNGRLYTLERHRELQDVFFKSRP